MEREKVYSRTPLKRTNYLDIVSKLKSLISTPDKINFLTLQVVRGTESWSFDRYEEFLAAIDGAHSYATLSAYHPELNLAIFFLGMEQTLIKISGPERSRIEELGLYIDSIAEKQYVPVPPRKDEPKPEIQPHIFIGHGGSSQWKDLKDHLTDLHRYRVIAYETGERAGHAIRDVIEEMLDGSSLAILVMTGEDEQPDGTFRARQNVVHEIGLFQGRLGFHKAVVLLEKGTEEFSNIHGVQQVRFEKGRISETFGHVLAFIKRETET